MGSIYIWAGTILFMLTMGLAILLNKTKIKPYILYALYLVLIFVFSFRIMKEIKEYNAFNQEDFSNIIKILIDDREIDKEIVKPLFEELKHDDFTWVDHPIKRKEYFINVYTHKRIYRFKIWDTYNQGVLVSRFDCDGKDFITNRNDKLLYFLNRNNEIQQ
ncbi:hypothetical protein ACQWU4_18055 [Chryseobacterium sp. MIQD13]|uniref:hypothetical protein n=1 Tax=Chryseobacterium sp. MIQD13 TaxID=3422310 RepID=UPI003D2C6C6B